ncbi:MAG: hypothetical protein NTX48_15010 [Planctomycetales bacterium]|nr:hypothetical protein [Planctomycetales bacterium]
MNREHASLSFNTANNSRSLTWDASYLGQFSGELLKVDQVWDVARSTAVNLSVVRAETG